MNELAAAVMLVILGMALAAIYYGGLWLTIRALGASRRPGVLLTISTIVRLAVVIAILALLVADDWREFFLGLAGFLIGGAVLRWWFAHRRVSSPATDPTAFPATDHAVSPATGHAPPERDAGSVDGPNPGRGESNEPG